MKLKILTATLLILLLINIISTTFSITSAFAQTLNTNSPRTENAANGLLKNADFNKTQKGITTSSSNEDKAIWNFNNQSRTNTTPITWGTNSTEIVVGLTNTWDAYTKIEQLALTKHAKITNKITIEGRTEAVVINTPRDSANSLITEIKQNNWNTYIEPNTKYQVDMTPNDPDWNLQWGPAKIQADYAWNTTTGSNKTLVCVIDTGIDYNHPDLAANYAPSGYDWVNNDSDPMDDHGHGTHCAGIIGAVINNNLGIAGIAQVRIMAEKALDAFGGGYEDDLANAIIDATNKGAKILSMSWGGGSSELIHDALKYAYAHGVLLVAAAGNSGSSAKHYPAAYDEVIAVTATDSSDVPAYFTTYGDWVELAAPGVDIYSTVIGGYTYMSGTSMACPHVSGTAALVWSEFPNMSRDVLRMHLRDTADDLGQQGFDIYYGYGRINVRRAIEEPLPEHDIIISNWNRPSYIEPGRTGRINATLINYGRHDETGITVELLVNGSVVQPSSIVDLASGTSEDISLSWTPTSNGNYNVTVYVIPVANEINVANNVVQGYAYVGIPLKVFVLRSAGTQLTQSAWDILNYNWKKFGDQLIYIDYTTLDKNNITYDDLHATGADVLILSCSYMWEYADAEIEAIKQYVYEGHGFIATAGTFYSYVPNNDKFAPMFGLNESISGWSSTSTDLLDLLEPSHSLFVNVPNPYTMPSVGTSLPPDGTWSRNELDGGKYVAMGFYNESTIVVYRGLVFISPWLEALPEQYFFNFQILYNAITWSRYQPPQHELKVTLDAPHFLFPTSTVQLHATVKNNGLQNETDVVFQLSIYDTTHNKPIFLELDTIPALHSGESYTISHPWNPTIKGVYNVTAYATPVLGEENLDDNKVTVLTTVAPPLIAPKEGQWANYIGYLVPNNATSRATMPQLVLFGMFFNYSKYISPYQMNITIFEIIYGQQNMSFFGWTIVNIGTRWCESGPIKNQWWLGMIETNITIGSIMNIGVGQATVIGNETIPFGTRLVDCWKLSQSDMGNYTWWYDKSDGLLIQSDFTPPNSGPVHERLVLDGTNIPTGYTPEHELLVTLNAASFISLGTSSILNAAVSNYGLKNETNVDLILEINGSIVDSLPIAKLATNEIRTVYHSWTPLAEGTCNVTAYVMPVPGESTILDNTATILVRVAAIKGHVLFDQTHASDITSNYNTWINSLRNLGYVIDVHTTGAITSDVLGGYDAFITVNAHASYSDQELAAIQEFVANGSGLLVVGDDMPGVYAGLTGFAGISWTYGGTGGFTTYINPHEVTQGVSTVYLLSPSAFLYQNSSSGQVLVRDYSFNIMLAVDWYQRGRVMGFADQDSLRDYGIGYVDNLRLATNMIVWLCEKDITPPQMIYIAPSNGTLIGKTTVTLHWLATDLQSGINYYETRIDSGLWINKGMITSHTFIGLSNGEHTIDVRAWDKAGNSVSSQVTISVDLTPPTVAILIPANNSYARQIVPINVSGSDANFDRMELNIDSIKVATFASNGTNTYYWDTLSESYSTHRITLIGYDKVGNSVSTTITVMIDNVKPIAIITSPANNTYVRGTITITFVAQDLALKTASLTIADTVVFNTTGNTSQFFDTETLPDGDYIVKLMVYDWAGNKAEASMIVKIDNTPPQAHVTYPTNTSYVKGTIDVTFTLNDTNLEKATLMLDGQFLANVTFTSSYSWSTILSHTRGGSHILTLTVLDMAGNSETDEVAVTVDNTSPTGEILAPSNGTYVKGTIDITCNGYDSNLNVMQLYVDGIKVPPYNWTTSETHIKPWNTATYSDGSHTVTLVIYDKAGNQFTTTITVIVDNTSPIVSISSPQGDSTSLAGIVNITCSASDNTQLVYLQLYIDDAKTTIYPNQTYQWDTTKVVDGNHTIKIIATDFVGNTKEATIAVKTTNTPPVYMAYIGYATAGILGLVLGALIVWLLLKRKPTPAPASPTTLS